MNKQFIILALAAIWFSACDKPNAETVNKEAIIGLAAIGDQSIVKANGSSILHFQATIAHATAADTRDITFILSDAAFGKFTGTSADNKQVIRSNADGTADAYVKLGTTPGTYFISSEVKIGDAIYKSDPVSVMLGGLSNSEKIQLTADNLQPEADAASIVNLEITSTYSQDKKVTLTSNVNGFLNSVDPKSLSLVLDDAGKATASFKVTNEITPNVITAKLTDGAVATVTLSPRVSYTDYLLVEPTALIVDTVGGSISLNTVLRKFNSSRKVTKNSQIWVDATQTVNGVTKQVGRFTGIAQAVSDFEGTVPAVKFFADTGGIDTSAPIKIIVSALNSSSQYTTATLNVTIKH